MFNQIGWSEVAVLMIAAIFIFGPERLPKLAADAGRTLRKARVLLAGVQEDLRGEMGPELAELDLRSLRPKKLVSQMLWDDDETPARAPRPAAPAPPAPVAPVTPTTPSPTPEEG